MFDVAEMFRDSPILVDAFIIERLHLRAKRNAELITRLDGYEKATMAGIINDQFVDGAKPLCDRLDSKSVKYDGVMVADRVVVSGMRLATGDIVARGDQCGEIGLCLDDEGMLMVIAKELMYMPAVPLTSMPIIYNVHNRNC